MKVELSPTDARLLVRLLRTSAEIIDKYTKKPAEADKARLLRKNGKKLQKKLELCITKGN